MWDVTVRHPAAARYATPAAGKDGAAISQAVKDKGNTYPAQNGQEAVPLVYNSWGRLGRECEDLLAECAELAAYSDYRRGVLPSCRLARWRAQLDADLHRAQLAMQHAAFAGLPGRPQRRTRPVDLSTLECSGE